MPLNKPAKDGGAGQIRYPDEGLMRSHDLPPTRPLKEQFLRAPPQTIGDVIKRIQDSEREKLSFDEWLYLHIGCQFEDWDGNIQYDDLKLCWKAAQENS